MVDQPDPTEQAEPTATPPSKRRRRFGLSLRLLMLLVLLLGGGMGWLAYQARVQREAVAAIEAAGGKVYYDLEWSSSKDGLTSRKPRWPKWLTDRLGPDYLGRVIAVQFLRGPSNLADDALMAHVGQLSGLENLELNAFDSKNMLMEGRCQVTDAGLGHLRSLVHLRRLDLHGTQIQGSGLANLSGMKRLKTLILVDLPISDEDLVPLESLTSLEELMVGGGGLTDAGMVHLAPLTQLRSLWLASDHVTSASLQKLEGWPRLEILWLRLARTVDYRFLSQFPELTELDLRLKGGRSGPRNQGLESIRTLSKLRKLSVDGFCDAESLLTHIGQLRELEQLSLSFLTDIPISDCSDLSKLTRLESLYLTGSMLDDSSLAHLPVLRRLKSLSLAGNAITNAGLAHLSALTELETLSLDNTKISDAGLVHLVPLKKCKSLTVRRTGVTVDGFSAFRAKQEAP